MNRRRYGLMEPARARLVEEILNGDWYGASTTTLSRRMCEYAGTTFEVVTAYDPLTGDMRGVGLYYTTQSTLKNLFLVMRLPSGRSVRWRAVRNVRTGRPIDPKRAERPGSHAKEGIWMRFKDLRAEDAKSVSAYYVRGGSDAQTAAVAIAATRRVLARYGPATRVSEVWDEIAVEIDADL